MRTVKSTDARLKGDEIFSQEATWFDCSYQKMWIVVDHRDF